MISCRGLGLGRGLRKRYHRDLSREGRRLGETEGSVHSQNPLLSCQWCAVWQEQIEQTSQGIMLCVHGKLLLEWKQLSLCWLCCQGPGCRRQAGAGRCAPRTPPTCFCGEFVGAFVSENLKCSTGRSLAFRNPIPIENRSDQVGPKHHSSSAAFRQFSQRRKPPRERAICCTREAYFCFSELRIQVLSHRSPEVYKALSNWERGISRIDVGIEIQQAVCVGSSGIPTTHTILFQRARPEPSVDD
jgi:hypothetical protein